MNPVKLYLAIVLTVCLVCFGGMAWDVSHRPALRCPTGSAYVPRMEVCLSGASYPIKVR